MSVNIWEGDKAQALIDAIASNEKINRQQGTGNSGKVLVVGSDGGVVPTYIILPDNVKSALMNCFAHVTWKDNKGEEYGEELRTALYNASPTPEPESDIIYEIPALQNTRCYSEISNVVARKKNEDCTIIVKGRWLGLTGESNSSPFVLDARTSANQVACRMQCNYTASGATVAFRSTFFNAGGNTTAHDATTEHDVTFIQRNASGVLTIKTFVNGILEYSHNNAIASTMEFDSTYSIGNNHQETIPFPGTYSIYRIYKVALTDEEISSIVGFNVSA